MSEPTSSRPDWGWPTRIAFRFSFLYLSLYLLMNGNVSLLAMIPFVGHFLAQMAARPAQWLALWLGTHWFHLTGIAARWHGGGSGDTALDYIRLLCFVGIALPGTVVWSVFDRRRPHYRTLFAWLRFFLRLFIGLGMLVYGLAKAFPLQMRVPSAAILNNTYGNSSPMTLLWTLIGLNPFYERICGLAEVIGGILILVRRTAVAGALLCMVVIANVVLYNFFFDVPVKIFSSHLLLICLYLLLPDIRPLWKFFVRHEAAELTGTWIPPASRRCFRIATAAVEVIFLVGVFITLSVRTGGAWRAHEQALAPTPLTGAWQIDSVDSKNPKGRPVSPEGQAWTALYIDDQRQGFYRSEDGALWRCGFKYDAGKSRLMILTVGTRADCRWKMPDSGHLTLFVENGKPPVTISTIYLHRIPSPDRYPLIERSFHWINEWGYER